MEWLTCEISLEHEVKLLAKTYAAEMKEKEEKERQVCEYQRVKGERVKGRDDESLKGDVNVWKMKE